MSESLMLVVMADACAASLSRNTLSMTDSSVLVVSRPQNADQSLTTIPAAITSLPRFTVPACTPNPLLLAALVPLSPEPGQRTGTHHQGDLQQGRQLILVLDGRLGVDQAALVAEGTVGPDQNLLGHRLTEHLHLQRVGQDLLRFLGQRSHSSVGLGNKSIKIYVAIET